MHKHLKLSSLGLLLSSLVILSACSSTSVPSTSVTDEAYWENLTPTAVGYADIGNRVWQDLNEDGIQQKPTEPGVNGVTVNLYEDSECNGTADTLLQSTETQDGGWYKFTELSPSKTYIIEVLLPEGNAFTAKYALGINHSGRDSDINTSSGLTDCIRVEANKVYADFDAGLIEASQATVTIGNRVWQDLNEDGVQQKPTEPGVNGVTVNLYEDSECNGSADLLLQTTQTLNGGWYSFAAVSTAKTYVIEVLLPEGSAFTEKHALGINHSGRDSDVNTSSGLTDCIRVEGNKVYADFDAGLVEEVEATAFIGNRVWQDLNEDGIQQKPDEPGVDGVTVNLYEDSECNGTADSLLQSAQTQAGGWYQFDAVSPAKTYVIEVLLPEGNAFTEKYALGISHSGRDSDINTSSGLTDCIRVEANKVYADFDAGIIEASQATATIGNRVWQDLNEDGVQQKPDEPGVDGVTINLYEDLACNGTADTLLQTKQTNGGGWYAFSELSPSKTYVIEVLLPEGNAFTEKYALGINHSGRDSDVNTSSGLTDCIRVEAGKTYADFDAGLIGLSRP